MGLESPAFGTATALPADVVGNVVGTGVSGGKHPDSKTVQGGVE